MIRLIKQLSVNLPRNALLEMYKSFVRPHIDYGDTLYDKPSNANFQDKMQKVQYRVCLVITGGIQGTSREKFYNELGLHSLVRRRRHNKLVFFIKLKIFYYQTTRPSSNKNRILHRNIFSHIVYTNEINLQLGLGMLNQLTSLKLCAHAELKLKLLNIFSCVVNFREFKDHNFLKILRKLKQIF